MKEQTITLEVHGGRNWAALRRYARLLVHSPTGMIGFVIIVVVVLAAIFAPWLTPFDPTALDPMNMRTPPAWLEGGTAEHLLGSDNLGRDILSRILYGARISLAVGVLSVVGAGVIGVVLGLISGYCGGVLDSVIMRITDAFHAIPRILLAMVVLMVAGSGVSTLIFVIGITSWVPFARLIRSEVLNIREKEFIKAATTIGTSHPVIMFKHILPNVIPSFIVLATMNTASSIITEAALSFLGVGIQPPAVSWGIMLADGRDYLASHWWVATFPGLAITITVLGIMFFGNWIRDVLDPHNQGLR